ncbi:MAG: hypothetical protein K0R57_6591 [Paenibacillaceae bacterium]|jgi:PDZ domain-containing protein|nr:hypothetical protein [Paenibacillaceae bacterium]
MNAINRGRAARTGRIAFSGLLALVFCYLILFIELPYYIYQPGTAENLQGMVQVNEGGYPESGSFLLTTVGVTRTNVLRLMEAGLRSYDVHKISQVRKEGESDVEYDQRQHQIMLTSQSNAVESAYRAAGIPYHVANAGVAVLRTEPHYPAYGILEPGDELVSVDGTRVASGGELDDVLQSKQAGESVMMQYRRGGVMMEAAFTLRQLPDRSGAPGTRLGIGMTTADLKAVEPDHSGQRVVIEAGEIGGPSAGFMFALEIYGLLEPEDLSKGYKIAGTGTIDADGRIGVVGSVRHKVAAADREGADLFFAPADLTAEGEGEPILNATEAAKQASKMRSDIKVVAVGSLEEAIRFLEKLPPKEAEAAASAS